ncbi:MAG: hypothetical protein IJ217_06345 [Clostridia bacterium]|nr:hypothetical protein [Clostridia bacterium]
MIIFLIVLIVIGLVLHSKVKFEIFFSFSNLDYHYCISVIYFKKLKTFYREDIEKWRRKRKEKRAKKHGSQAQNGFWKSGKKVFPFLQKYLHFEKLIVDMRCGLIGVLPSVFSIPVLSTGLAYIYAFFKIPYSKNCHFSVLPAYDKFELTSKLHCIVSLKMVHIIFIIILFYRERRKKNERTSNRRAYEYCYE